MKEIWRQIGSTASSNVGLAVLSFIIALGLWIAGHRDTERAIEVPVEFRNIPSDLMVLDNRVDYVVLRLSGPRTLVSTLDADDLKLLVDLYGSKAGSLSFPLGPSAFNIPRGVTVARITPPIIHLRLDPVIKRELPVSIRLSGKPLAGYKIEEMAVQPESVSVRGPADEIRRMSLVETLPIDVERSRSSIKRTVRLSTDGKPLSFMPEQVSVAITIVEEDSIKDFKNVEIGARGASGDYVVTPKSAQVRLFGPRRILDKLELGADQVYVDVDGLAPGEHSLELKFNLPAEIKVVEEKPARFKVKISKSHP
jgi:YbbR domain-containing protein